MVSNEVWIEVKDIGQRRIYAFVVLRIKPDDDGTGPKHKARIVAGGDKQIANKDYDPDNISFSVLKNTTLKLLICKAIELGFQIYHIDIVTAFLNSPVKYEIYMELPSELVQFGTPKLVKLLKGLYGCHDSGRLWYDLLHTVLVNDMKFIQSTNDPCLYIHSTKTIFTGVYVDDLPLVASQSDYEWFCKTLAKFFKLTDKGPMRRCLGIDIKQTVHNNALTDVILSQEKYIINILNQFGFNNSKPVYTPAVPNTFLISNMPDTDDTIINNDTISKSTTDVTAVSEKSYPSLVGSLLWLALQTRPEISQAVSQLSRFVSNPSPAHLTAAKHLLRYLNGSRALGIHYSSKANSTPLIYSDATWASDPESSRSVQAYVTLLYGGAVSWHCGIQKSVSLSTTESEWFALSETCKESIYLKHAMSQLRFSGIKQWTTNPMTIFEDNQAVIKIAVSGEPKHKHQKHILVRLQYVREQVASKTILPVYIPSADNVADVLTKNLPRESFERFRTILLG